MRIDRLFVVLCLMAALLSSCKKDHYNVSNVHGVNAEGELLLPIVARSLSMMDMMALFQIDSLINCSETGALSYSYYFEDDKALSGDKLLWFKDLNYFQHFAFENPYSSSQPSITDTVISFEKTIVFESDHISVLEAMMKSGHLDFLMESNVGNLYRVILRSSDIHDNYGRDFVLDTQVQANVFGFDLVNLHYQTETANTLTFSYELYCYFNPTDDPELFVDFHINGRDLAMRSMCGFVESYSDRNRLDTVISLFPENLTGILEVEGVSMRIRERNTFPLASCLVVDTVLMMGDVEPYSIFEPLPLTVDLPVQMDFGEVFSQSLHGRTNACGGSAYASSNFIMNPEGINEMVTVYDTCSIDVKVGVEIPFAFKTDSVRYVDTINLKISELDMSDLIERITIELTLISTLPLNMKGQFYMYDSENGMITDVLLPNAKLIQASFDGQPITTTVSIDLTEERIEHALHSDHIIMVYELDTEAHDVKLNANQKLDLFAKARVKYNGVVEP